MASEWIKRSDREPPQDRLNDFEIIAAWPNGEVHAGWRHEMLDTFDYWMPLPPPPERMVTIEISEADARSVAEGRNVTEADGWVRVRRACAAALAKESPSDGDR